MAYNAALVLVLVFVYDLIARYLRHHSLAFKLLTGLALGLFSIAVMAAAWRMPNGVIFDTRSVLLSMGTLFYGTVPGAIAGAIAAAFRAAQGGAGAVMGVSVIAMSVIVGAVWRRWRSIARRDPGVLELYLFGLTIHAFMLLLTAALPDPLATLRAIAVPVIVIYPLASVLLGLLMIDQRRHRRAVVKLRESEERFRGYFEQSLVGTAVTSPEKVWIEVNQATCDLLGYGRDELVGLTWAELTHPDDLDTDVAQFDRVLAGEIDGYRLGKRFIRKDGAVVDVDLGVRCLYKPDGTPDRILALLSDVTERRRLERHLDAERRSLKLLFENSGEAILLTQPDGTVLAANPEACRMFGRSEAEMRTAGRTGLVDTGDPRLAPALEERARTGRASTELRFVRRDGCMFPGEVSTRVYIDHDGAERTSMIIRDLSERKQAEEEALRQAELLRRTVEGAVLAMSQIVETRDPYTAGHERRVSELATAIAQEMGMGGDELIALRLGALIHDIGKVGVPAEILSKPGRLNESELNLIRQHPATGHDILGAIDFGLPVAEMVLQHHERMDGSGYPHGLTGPDILLTARILAVADVIEAIASHRPYRPALGLDVALAEIHEQAGAKYDTKVAAACDRVFAAGFAFSAQ